MLLSEDYTKREGERERERDKEHITPHHEEK
jgi:hypothetical protein